MMFSIIVPVYNTEKYLNKCIQSILTQSFSDYELIIIDDGSTDSSLFIAQKYAGNKVKIFQNRVNLGLSSSRNKGIDNSLGEYILFIDSDDYIDENALMNIKNIIYNNKFPDIIYTGFIEERPGCSAKNYGYVSEKNRIYTNYEFMKGELEKRNLYAAACFGIYKRSVIVDNNLYFKPGIFHEDELWTPQVLYKSKWIYLSELSYYHYVRRKDSITKVKDKTQNGIDLIQSCMELINIFSTVQDDELRKLMYNHVAMLYMKAMCRGRLYRREYSQLLDRSMPLKYSSTLIDKIKACIFFLCPYIYYILDLKFGDNEK